MGVIEQNRELSEDIGLYFTKQELVPAIVQDVETGDVLMLAYMNEESLQKTLETGYTWFYSRSRRQLWNKGETSGHVQRVVSITPDCDNDTFLVKVEQTGPACHTGNRTCFYKEDDILTRLYDTVADRRKNPQEGSYTCYLFEKGLDKILKKCGEECTEMVIAAKEYQKTADKDDKSDLENEICDLIYHTMVMMQESNIAIGDIYYILEQRSKKIGNKKEMKTVDRNS